MSTNNLYLKVPNADVVLVSMLAQKMGWTIETNDSIMDHFINTRPTDVPLSDEDIMNEVRAVRYAL